MTLGIVIPGRPRLQHHWISKQRAPETRAPLRIDVGPGRRARHGDGEGAGPSPVASGQSGLPDGSEEGILVDFNSPREEGRSSQRMDWRQFQAARGAGRGHMVADQGNLADGAGPGMPRPSGNFERTSSVGSRARVARRRPGGGGRTPRSRESRRRRARRGRSPRRGPRATIATSASALRDNRLAHRRHRPVTQRRHRPEGGGHSRRPALAHDGRGSAQDAGRHRPLSEADVGQDRVGHRGDFTVRRVTRARPARATIRQIRNAPMAVQNVVTYDAVVDVDNSELEPKARA